MIKINKTQAEALANKIRADINASREQRNSETLKVVSEFPEVKEVIRNIHGALEALSRIPSREKSIRLNYRFITPETKDEDIAETVCQLMYPEKFVSLGSVSPNTLVNEIILESIMTDDIRECIKKLTEKYA